jgi:hypothetical protein
MHETHSVLPVLPITFGYVAAPAPQRRAWLPISARRRRAGHLYGWHMKAGEEVLIVPMERSGCIIATPARNGAAHCRPVTPFILDWAASTPSIQRRTAHFRR